MAGRLPMGQKELLRGKLVEMAKQGKMTLKSASIELKTSCRQGKRLYKAYRGGGDAALIHGNVGNPSNRKTDREILGKAMALYREKHPDFGPTFAAEKLGEVDGLWINVSALRRVLLAEGLWERKRRSCECRIRRERRPCFGELIQFDGSRHDWLEGRGPRCCLITMTDDATNTRLAMFFEEETLFGAMTVLKAWIQRYGMPQALYCDKKNAFVLTREPTDAELLNGITKAKSHFGRACEKLGIEMMAANSPQSKGRVERNRGLDQYRLAKELRLAGISTMEQANAFLGETHLPNMNAKFSRPPACKDDAHVSAADANLSDILCEEHNGP